MEVDHTGKIKQSGREKSEEQNERRRRVAVALPHRHSDVKEKGQNVNHDEKVERTWNFKEFAAFPPVQMKTGNGDDAYDDEADELNPSELFGVDLAVTLFGDDEIGGTHKSR